MIYSYIVMIIRDSDVHAVPKSWTLPSFSPICLKIIANSKQIWIQQKLVPGLSTRERKCFWQEQHVREVIIISCIFSNQGCSNATKKRGESIKAKIPLAGKQEQLLWTLWMGIKAERERWKWNLFTQNLLCLHHISCHLLLADQISDNF